MSPRALALAALVAAGVAEGQDRPSEDALFGAPAAAPTPAAAPRPGEVAPSGGAPDAGATATAGGASEPRPSEAALFGDVPASADAGPTAARPSEAALFGDTSAASGTGPAEAPGTGLGPGSRDEAQLFGPPATSRFDTHEEKEDPLKVGGMLYLRAATAVADGNSAGQIGLSAPSLMDGYFDARPSDRVRGMMLARLQYDPTLAQGASGSPLPGAAAVPNPSIGLDQLWVRFDVEHVAFVTAGKQHVKWGASRFWNPTDFLTPERKDPLAAFDARLGATMLKIHVPWEAKGWNFYGIGLFDNAGPANTLGKLGGAARAEVVLGSTEIGAEGVFVGGRRPRFGIDLSSPLGPIDVYGEVAFRSGSDFRVWTFSREPDWTNPMDAIAALEAQTPTGVQAQASGGLTYTFNYTDKNALTVGAEYFYNPLGASSPALYPWLLFQNQFQPFYVGQHYAAVYAMAPGLPGDLPNVTLSLVTLGNLTDRSFVSRLDAFVRVLSYLSVELYGAAHYGTKGGEFRFALDLPPMQLVPGQFTPAVSVAAPVLEAGAGLRVSL